MKSDKRSDMPLDRLEALLPGLLVEAAGLEVSGPNLFVSREGGGIRIAPDPQGPALLQARLSFGPAVGQLWTSLPSLTLDAQHALHPLVSMMVTEASAPRCGSAMVLQGYVQSLVVHLMRGAIEGGLSAQGVLAGLADPRLARVLVALHDDPARDWRIEDMAAKAGMSRSSFMALFSTRLGETPAAYLRRWRMEKAKADLASGGRVGVVARRYGYTSADAFRRAMKAHLAGA